VARAASDFERARRARRAEQSRAPSLDVALDRVRAATELDLRVARARAGFTRGHLLEIVFSLPGGSGNERERSAAQDLVWEIVGARRAQDWIGAVELVAAPRGGPLKLIASKPGHDFPLALDELWRSAGGDWTLFELEPEAAEDFAQKDDLVMAVTRVPELLKCYLARAPFSSLRFSRHGELFFHLKYESRGKPETRLAVRERLEAELDRELAGAEAGRVVGGGLGLYYSYVDFALSSIEAGLKLVASCAREQNLPARTWIECFDDELRADWVEIRPDTPAPPERGA
jgi:hypothetical protein